jgi:hypothetical protein
MHHRGSATAGLRCACHRCGPVACSAVRRAPRHYSLPASAERTALANNLTNEGVDLTAGQRTDSKPLQWMESTLGDMPGSGRPASRVQENQGQQFTAAALQRVDETADRATPEVVDNAFKSYR